MITRPCSTCRASAACRSPQGLLVVDNLINSVASLTCTQLFYPGRTIAAMLPTEFSDASGSVLYKRFACRPRLIRDLQTMLKRPWSEAVILQGEPTIGKVKLVRSVLVRGTQPARCIAHSKRQPALPSELGCRWVAASLQRDFIYVQCTTASTVLSTLKEIIRQVEIRIM